MVLAKRGNAIDQVTAAYVWVARICICSAIGVVAVVGGVIMYGVVIRFITAGRYALRSLRITARVEAFMRLQPIGLVQHTHRIVAVQ